MIFSKLFKRKEKASVLKAQNTTALVLGGGGARGFAHLGVFKAFEEEGFDFDFCVGTSVGSLMGALYCAGVKSAEMIPYAEQLDLKQIHRRFLLMPDDPSKIGKLVTNLLGDALIEDLAKPFYCVAVDLVEARQVVFDSGKVALAVSASCCVPGLYRPVVDGARHLVDGGLLNNIPSETAKMLGAQKIVAVDINPTRGHGTPNTGMWDVLKATFRIMSANSSQNGLRNADVVIAPDMGKFSASKKDGYEEMIELGYLAAKAQADTIRKLLNRTDK
ncbi:MAG: patatin-like phospholipase family protein [Firmicutes bacterium]|nr:patatin-like phospholipase family protein [Bacillota bacterium]